MKNIVFDHVKKAYGKTVIIKDLNLEILPGERLILLGPSGCGKSTTLRMIAGLEEISGGDLYMDGVRVNDVPCGKRGVSMVFQNYAIYPHMTVKDNITYGLRARHEDPKEIERRLKDALEMLRLEPYADRKPKGLSGGQRQRVALARAIVKQADYFLLDEPLSNLDAQLRLHARKELVRIHEKYHNTMIYVTHDQVEAMTVANRIALMNGGDLVMLDTPANVYNHPEDIFAAKFIGSPSMNIVEASCGDGVLAIGEGRLTLPQAWADLVRSHPAADGTYMAGIRPEHLFVSHEPQPGRTLQGVIKYRENYGSRTGVYVEPLGTDQELIILTDEPLPENGSTINFGLDFNKFHLFDKETQKTLGDPAAAEAV